MIILFLFIISLIGYLYFIIQLLKNKVGFINSSMWFFLSLGLLFIAGYISFIVNGDSIVFLDDEIITKLIEEGKISDKIFKISKDWLTVSIPFIVMFFSWSLPKLIKYYELIEKNSSGNIEQIKKLGLLASNIKKNKPINTIVNSNLLLSKLINSHEPINRIKNFEFIRRITDYCTPVECDEINRVWTNNTLIDDFSKDAMKVLKKFEQSKIKDFEIILDSINEKWYTVSFGDISTLLENKDYLIKQIKKENKFNSFHLPFKKKTTFKRIFVYPYIKGNPTSSENKLEFEKIKNIQFDENQIKDIFDISSTTEIYINDNELQKIYADEFVRRTIKDLIFLYWILSIHDKYNLDYELIPSNKSKDNKNNEIGDLLSNWNDEGVALLDDSLIVRFDETGQRTLNHSIHYKFIEPNVDDKKIFKSYFEGTWKNETFPDDYDLKQFQEFLIALEFSDNFISSFLNSNVIKEKTNEWFNIFEKTK